MVGEGPTCPSHSDLQPEITHWHMSKYPREHQLISLLDKNEAYEADIS
jgi:hypothetical protein